MAVRIPVAGETVIVIAASHLAQNLDVYKRQGVILSLSGMFDLTIHGERYCVLGEFWKEADGDQLLLRPGEETIWYYAHEQDKVKRLCNDMTELLEKKLARYLNEQ